MCANVGDVSEGQGENRAELCLILSSFFLPCLISWVCGIFEDLDFGSRLQWVTRDETWGEPASASS